MKRPEPQHAAACSICGVTGAHLFGCDGGQICEECSETTRQGRDNTSRALKSKRAADQLQVDLLTGQQNARMTADESDYSIASGGLMSAALDEVLSDVAVGSGGEVVSQEHAGLINTLTEPKVAALEASNHRTELLTMLGTDIAAMALDAADTIEADNSLERMLAHQMAAIHQMSMKMAHRANLTADPAVAVKTMNAAMKGFATYQGALSALRHIRGSQHQHIVVQHVNVASGGQAMVGSVSARGGRAS